MKLHFLVEGPAEVTFLEQLLPRLIPAHTWQVYPHQGKGRLSSDPTKKIAPTQRGLLDNLPAKLRAWGRSLDPAVDRVVVLVDADDEDCSDLLSRLKKTHKSIDPSPPTLFRLAIEETEAWFLGDPKAIRKAYPKAKVKKLEEWKPDSVCGSWELFQKVIEATSENKPEWGEAMGRTLTVDEPLEKANRSPSFRRFCRRVREHAGEPPVATPARRKLPTKTERKAKR